MKPDISLSVVIMKRSTRNNRAITTELGYRARNPTDGRTFERRKSLALQQCKSAIFHYEVTGESLDSRFLHVTREFFRAARAIDTFVTLAYKYVHFQIHGIPADLPE